jgi:RNA polymerase sigma-70 factor (ECF subfamily)
MDASGSLLPFGSADSGQLERWLGEARGGSRSALGRALEAARVYLLLIANRALDDKLKSKVGASDLVQDTFIEAQRDFDQFRGATRDDFHACLIGILANRLANNVRRYRLTQGRDVHREIPVEAVPAVLARLRDETATPGANVILREEQHRVQQALEQMSEPLRSILVERTWQGLSFAEIGRRRALSTEAARKTWARAVRELHKLLLLLQIE